MLTFVMLISCSWPKYLVIKPEKKETTGGGTDINGYNFKTDLRGLGWDVDGISLTVASVSGTVNMVMKVRFA
jgi:hypothetical protein